MTHWEGAELGITVDSAAIFGQEVLTQAMLDDFGPATLVRLRGCVIASWVSSLTAVSETNNPAVLYVAIRKVVLARTTDAYSAPSGALDDGAYLSGEDILYFGAVKLDGAQVGVETSANPDTAVTFQRASGVLELDVKAMRRFESAEERLVLETMLQVGQVTHTDVSITGGLRMLFKAG